jgi:uncharacterized membrane protein YcaP (DUF421 family)
MKLYILEISIAFFKEGYPNIILRAVSVYLFIILAIRIFGKKELAQLSVIDLVFILLISNAVQNAMIGPDTSLDGGLVAAASLFLANYTMKRLLYNNKIINELVQGETLLLIYKGVPNMENCAKAEITIEELEAAAREHGSKDIQNVDLAMLEVDGNISIISSDFQKQGQYSRPRKHKLKGRLNQN